MRQFKFRAWHYDDGMLYFEFDSFQKDYHDQYGNIMEFTGLHDIDGKEIFEADILKENLPRGNVYKVFRVPGGFAINSFQDDFNEDVINFYQSLAEMQTASYIQGNCKIIGNVYQNPELCTTKSK